jgi:hypothetical protein
MEVSVTKNFRRALGRGFRILQEHGYFAKQNWKCCQTCGTCAVPDEYAEFYVFYHEQDAECLRNEDKTYLAWAGIGEEIVEIFRAEGLQVEWNGSRDRRILVRAPALN